MDLIKIGKYIAGKRKGLGMTSFLPPNTFLPFKSFHLKSGISARATRNLRFYFRSKNVAFS